MCIWRLVENNALLSFNPVYQNTMHADCLAALWQQRDLDVVWHPCTQMREHPEQLPLITIKQGQGIHVIGHNGKRYIDAISSWWTNLFGHGEQRIAQAIARQAEELEHVMLAGFSHTPAIMLAEALLALAPRQADYAPLRKVFYADNGSAAIEVALKMAFHFFHNKGERARSKFIALENGYHGETLGALAVGDIPLYRTVYGPLLTKALFAPSPDAYLARPDESSQDYALHAAKQLEQLFERHPGEICALILEPLVQCAGGMRMYDPVYLQRARTLCDMHGAFLIADEIATGFGRTGTLFACQQARVMPDILCLSKGLSGGFLPLAAVLTTQHIYEGFLDTQRERAFLHSHSYTGNPLACAAALATLRIFEEDAILERNMKTAQLLGHYALPIKEISHVADVRQKGMILAFELTPDGTRSSAFPSPYFLGLQAYRHALEQGIILRPLGSVLYWMPPYCITESDIQHLAKTTSAAILQALKCV